MLKPMMALAALAFTSALVVPTVSQAREYDADEINTAVVSYADLNLAGTPGQSTLKRRIVHAAREVCVYEDSRDMVFATQVNNCRGEAIARAQPAYDAAVAAARRGSVTVIDAAALIISAR